MRMKKRLAVLLALAMMITLFPLSAFAEQTEAFSDMPDNWSTSALEHAAANGLLLGYHGEIRPDDNLTRAEMAAVVNRAFGAAEQASLEEYTDVPVSSWYYGDMAKAVRMGTFAGYGNGLLQPEKDITREEAFVVLARAFQLSDPSSEPLARFTDGDTVSSWSKNEISALAASGYIAGADGKLNLKQNITRAEFAKLMDNLVKQYIREAGTYTEVTQGNVMISVPGVMLKDLTVDGDLMIGDGVGDGEVTLDHVEVTGRVVVRGGGVNSIVIKGDSTIGSIVITRVDGQVRLYAEDGTEIGTVTVDGLDDVILEGDFASVLILADHVTVTALNAEIETVQIDGDHSNLIVQQNSSVHMVSVYGDGVRIEGSGDVEEVIVYSSDVTVETIHTSVTAAPGSSNVLAIQENVEPGTTVITGTGTTTSSGGGGGGVSGAAAPAASPDAGEIDFAAEVTLSCTTGGASIYYTTDGSAPTTSSTLYSDPLLLLEDTVLKAIAVKSGLTDSSVSTFEYTVLPGFAGGLGTEEDPYQVETAEQLNHVRYLPDAYFIQIDDIDLSDYLAEGGDGYNDGAKWLPIGTEESPFHGTYDGDGYDIVSLAINRPDGQYLGLFGYTQGRTVDETLYQAVIRDVHLSGVEITGKWYVGSLTGSNSYHTELINCSAQSIDLTATNANYGTFGGLTGMNRGTVTDCSTSGEIAGSIQTGGLAGISNNGRISRCSADVEITGQSGYFGGLVGYNSYGDIDGCCATGNVSGWYGIGGLVGSHYSGTISNCHATGNATSAEERSQSCYVGGFIGMIGPGTIQYSYAAGEVTAETAAPTGPLYLGGFVGKLPDVGTQPTFTNCYYDTETSGQSDTGKGTPLTTVQMTDKNNFSNWDFTEGTGVWAIETAPPSYPYLQWQEDNIPYPIFAGGSGTAEDPYQVGTASQLDHVRDYLDCSFIQIANIDLTGTGNWEPIGFHSSAPNAPGVFSGSYDGQHYKISNMSSVYQAENDNYIGLFASLNSATIENVVLEDADVNGYMLVGSLAGYAYSSTIDHCSSSGNVVGEFHSIGGLVGYNHCGTISNSDSAGTVQAGYGTVGGLAGRLYEGIVENCGSSAAVTNLEWYDAGGLVGSVESASRISGSYATGDVTGDLETGGLAGRSIGSGSAITGCFAAGDVTGESKAGGLIGLNDSSCVLSNSYATGSVSCNDMAGGFAGQNIGTITNGYASGSVSANTNIGGFVGTNTDTLTTGTISACYYDKDTSGQTDDGKGIPKSTAEMITQATFTGWDFTEDTGVWAIDDDPVSYPYLQWQTDNIPMPLWFAGGSGTAENPYQVATAAQLDLVRECPDRHFIQTADISLSDYLAEGGDGYHEGAGWEPIGCYTVGDNTTQFSGNYDGNGKSITGLWADRPATEYVGLFGYVAAAAVLEDITLDSVDISGSSYTGGLVGMSWGTVTACSSAGTVSGSDYTGGLVGQNDGGGTVSGSYSSASASGNTSVGGLVGNNLAEISGSFASGNVAGASRSGGLAGNNNGTLEFSYATGSVTGTTSYTGGLTGFNATDGDIIQCYSTGLVTSEGTNAGGLVGYNRTGASVSASYYNSDTSGQGDNGIGTRLTTQEMLDQNNFIGWDFTAGTGVWSIDADPASYPYLQWQTDHKPVPPPL